MSRQEGSVFWIGFAVLAVLVIMEIREELQSAKGREKYRYEQLQDRASRDRFAIMLSDLEAS